MVNLPERPLLSGLFHVIPIDGGNIRLSNAGRTFVLPAGDRFDDVVGLLGSLDGVVTTLELESRFPAVAGSVLGALARKGLLLEGAGGVSTLRVGLGSTFGQETALPSLDTLTATVVGCGPMGGTSAMLLAQVGVGRLVLVDGVPTTEHDAYLTPDAVPCDMGEPRGRAVAAACASMGRSGDQWVPELDADALSRSDIVIIEMGYAAAGVLAADACLTARKPFVTLSQDALQAVVASIGPSGKPCHHCLDARTLSHRSDIDFCVLYRHHRSQTCPGPDTFLPCHAAIVGGVAATEALRRLCGSEPDFPQPVAVIDLDTCVIHREVALPVPGCAHCDDVDYFTGMTSSR